LVAETDWESDAKVSVSVVDLINEIIQKVKQAWGVLGPIIALFA